MRRRRQPHPLMKVTSAEALGVVRDLQRKFKKKRPTDAARASVTAYLAEKYTANYLRLVGARLLADVFKRTLPGKAAARPRARRAKAVTGKGKAAPKPHRAPRARARAAYRRRRARS
jgi:hypothetical protein